ncbi:hypothetical protein ACFVT2_20685 [Streptomyces sp. NPDC058000]|uniref:hypothetical protein n=1 Tax=Streptomyces sp. NPDC058000 TaxID=3346299 RepID=UPI0036F00315
MPNSSRIPLRSRAIGRRRLAALATAAATFALTGTLIAAQPAAGITSATAISHRPSPQAALAQVSSDPFTNSSSQHATELEPDTFAHGNTIVSSSQVGRFTDGGASDIGWNASTDGGATWQHGMLPGITTYEGGGSWARASDLSVAYDARHGTWMVTGLVIDTNVNGAGVTVSRSPNGTNWHKPVMAVGNDGQGYDKEWIVCDNSTGSPHYGSCYIEVDVTSSGNTAKIGLYYYFYPKANCSASTCQLEVGHLSPANGGSTWNTAQTIAAPMSLNQIAGTTQGSMVGDYLSTSVIGGKAVSVFAVGKAPTGGQAFDEAMHTAGGLAVNGGPVRAQQAAHDSAPNPGVGAGRVPLRTAR